MSGASGVGGARTYIGGKLVPKLLEQLNGNVHYQIFCDISINPLRPLKRTPSLLSGKSAKSQLWNAAKPAKSNRNRSHGATGN